MQSLLLLLRLAAQFSDSVHILDTTTDILPVFPHSVGAKLFNGLRLLSISRLFAPWIHVNLGTLFHRNVLKGLEDTIFVDRSDAHCDLPVRILARFCWAEVATT